MTLLDLMPPDPHPEWVASVRPTAAQIFDAAHTLGWFPADPFLYPAVPVRRAGE